MKYIFLALVMTASINLFGGDDKYKQQENCASVERVANVISITQSALDTFTCLPQPSPLISVLAIAASTAPLAYYYFNKNNVDEKK